MRGAKLLCLLGSALVAGCGVSGSAAGEVDDLPAVAAATPEGEAGEIWIDFEDWVLEYGTALPGARNSGTAAIKSSVSTLRGGRVRLARSLHGGAAGFPAYAEEQAAAAAILVTATGREDVLSPGTADFSFGADFTLDAVSDGSDSDNGDNLVQRGLSADPVQYKIQIDRGVPSCRIAGAAGAVLVKLPEPVQRNRWYRVRCSRSGSEVKLALHDLERPSAEAVTATTQGRTGAIAMTGGMRVPMSIGAKVLLDGSIPASSTDQFNGRVDNVHYALAD